MLENPRDFTDRLLMARQDAEREEDSTELGNITDVHIRQTLFDLFFGMYIKCVYVHVFCIHLSKQARTQMVGKEFFGI